MRITSEDGIQPAASSSSTAGRSDTAAASDFKTLYAETVRSLWSDYQETGLTPADQLIKERGGDELLQYKHDLEKKRRQAEKGRRTHTPATVETIHKYMPDGSILVITTKNGKVTEQRRNKPRMVSIPDPIQPPKAEDQTAATTQIRQKLVPRRNLLED